MVRITGVVYKEEGSVSYQPTPTCVSFEIAQPLGNRMSQHRIAGSGVYTYSESSGQSFEIDGGLPDIGPGSRFLKGR